MKLIINKCYGGFGFSDSAIEKYEELSGLVFREIKEFRTDPTLIHIMETFGSEFCSNEFSRLKVVEIPDDVEYKIQDYDGIESVITGYELKWYS